MVSFRQLLSPVLAASVFISPFNSWSAPSNATAASDLAQLASDRAKTNAWVQAETISRITQSPNSSLTYVALNLAGAKDEKSLNRILDAAKNDGINPVMDRQSTVNAIKAGAKLAGVEGADGAVDALNNITRDIENSMGNAGAKIPFSPESQAAALIGAVKNMPPDLQEKAMRGIAQIEGLNYDQMRGEVTAGRMIRGTPSKNDIEKASNNKALDQAIIDRGFSQLQEAMDVQTQATKDLQKQLLDDRELEKKKAEINSRTEHFKAGVYLAGTLLGPIIGKEKAKDLMAVGNGIAMMQDALAKFGPGGLSADKLLMCTNFVSAGMMVAQIFMKQQDPTMAALSSIMQQLEAIKAELDKIDHKIDHLTDLVVQGFDDVLHQGQYLNRDLDRIKSILDNDIRGEQERQAVNTYLKYLSKEKEVSGLANDCASPLKTKDTASCAVAFADELSTKPLADVDLGNIGSPQMFDPAWTNRALSVGVSYDLNYGGMAQFYFSLPTFFANSPQAFSSMIARNHEAVAAASQALLQVPHVQTLANPEILAVELKILLEAAKVRPDLLKVPFKDRLFSQAIQRVTDIENFAHSTINNGEFLTHVWKVLADTLKFYDDGVQAIVADALNRPKDNARKALLGDSLAMCPGNGVRLPLPAPGPTGNIDSLVPDIYWAAQDMGLGRLGACFEWQSIEARMSGNAAFHNVRYRIKLFFNPAKRQADGSYQLDALQSGRVILNGSSQIIQSRIIDSVRHYSTLGASTTVAFARAWNGAAATPGEVYECAMADEEMTNEQCFPPNRPIPQAWLMTQGVNEIPDAQVTAVATGVANEIYATLGQIMRSRTQVWVPEQLANESIREERLLYDHATTKSVDLKTLMAFYSSRYMFAEQLLLLSAYHGNTITDCLAALERFSPQKVIENFPNVFSGRPWRMSDAMTPAMDSVASSCVGHNFNSDLATLKAKLQKLP